MAVCAWTKGLKGMHALPLLSHCKKTSTPRLCCKSVITLFVCSDEYFHCKECLSFPIEGYIQILLPEITAGPSRYFFFFPNLSTYSRWNQPWACEFSKHKKGSRRTRSSLRFQFPSHFCAVVREEQTSPQPLPWSISLNTGRREDHGLTTSNYNFLLESVLAHPTCQSALTPNSCALHTPLVSVPVGALPPPPSVVFTSSRHSWWTQSMRTNPDLSPENTENSQCITPFSFSSRNWPMLTSYTTITYFKWVQRGAPF